MGVSIYVEPEALAQWSSEMSKINIAAIEDLTNFKKNVDDLDGPWAGDAAKGFLDENESFFNVAENCHNNMSEVENLLLTVVEVMEKE